MRRSPSPRAASPSAFSLSLLACFCVSRITSAIARSSPASITRCAPPSSPRSSFPPASSRRRIIAADSSSYLFALALTRRASRSSVAARTLAAAPGANGDGFDDGGREEGRAFAALGHGRAVDEDALAVAPVAHALHDPVVVLLLDRPLALTREARDDGSARGAVLRGRDGARSELGVRLGLRGADGLLLRVARVPSSARRARAGARRTSRGADPSRGAPCWSTRAVRPTPSPRPAHPRRRGVGRERRARAGRGARRAEASTASSAAAEGARIDGTGDGDAAEGAGRNATTIRCSRSRSIIATTESEKLGRLRTLINTTVVASIRCRAPKPMRGFVRHSRAVNERSLPFSSHTPRARRSAPRWAVLVSVGSSAMPPDTPRGLAARSAAVARCASLVEDDRLLQAARLADAAGLRPPLVLDAHLADADADPGPPPDASESDESRPPRLAHLRLLDRFLPKARRMRALLASLKSDPNAPGNDWIVQGEHMGAATSTSTTASTRRPSPSSPRASSPRSRAPSSSRS